MASVSFRDESTETSKYFIADVVSTAKTVLKSDDVLDGEGGFMVFDTLVPAEKSPNLQALPIVLSDGTKLKRTLAKGTISTYADVELDKSLPVVQHRREFEKMAAAGGFKFAD